MNSIAAATVALKKITCTPAIVFGDAAKIREIEAYEAVTQKIAALIEATGKPADELVEQHFTAPLRHWYADNKVSVEKYREDYGLNLIAVDALPDNGEAFTARPWSQREDYFKSFEKLGAEGSLEEILEAVSRPLTTREFITIRRTLNALPRDMDWWRKNEAVNIAANQQPRAEASEITFDKRLGLLVNGLKNVPVWQGVTVDVRIADNALQTVKDAVFAPDQKMNPDLSREFGDAITRPFEQWMKENAGEIGALAGQFKGGAIFLDGLPLLPRFSAPEYDRMVALEKQRRHVHAHLNAHGVKLGEDAPAPAAAAFAKKKAFQP